MTSGPDQGCRYPTWHPRARVVCPGVTKSAGGLPGSDQKRGWLFATYALILRIHFSPLTHIPRALRLRARMGPKPPRQPCPRCFDDVFKLVETAHN
eukprot:1183485-Prorocentrum_minimum.AAC.1